MPLLFCFLGEVNDYQLPYFNLVSHDPSFDEMRRVVVGQKMRPSIEKRWKNEEVGVVVCVFVLCGCDRWVCGCGCVGVGVCIGEGVHM